MKQSKSLSLGHAYSQIDQLLSMEQELSEVTFHYGAGVRLHLDSDILGICHAKELLASFLYKRSSPCLLDYYLFSGIYSSGKGKEGLCGYVMKDVTFTGRKIVCPLPVWSDSNLRTGSLNGIAEI